MSLRLARPIPVLAAGAVSANVLAGTQLERLPRAARLDLAMTTNAIATDDLRCTWIVGGQLVLDDIQVQRSNNVTPIFPDDFVDDAVGLGGVLIELRFRQAGTTGTSTGGWSIKATPV